MFQMPLRQKRVTVNPGGVFMHLHLLKVLVRLLSIWGEGQQELLGWRPSLTGCPQNADSGGDGNWGRLSPSPLVFFSRPSGDALYQIFAYGT